MGLVASGLLPVLLPLFVVQVSHRLDFVAYVTGAYNLGLLSAPLLGALAERSRAYRMLFLGGFVLIGVGTAGIPVVSHLAPWLVLGVAVGVGTAAVTVIGNLLIVDFVPPVEWEPRLGWLQGFSGAGLVAGLLLAAVFAADHIARGIWVGAATTLPALVIGRIGLPIGEPSVTPHASPGLGTLPHQAHRLSWADVSRLPAMLRHPFGRFLLSWFAYNLGVAAFYAYFPLLMRRSFAIEPGLTAAAYAVSATLGTALFVLAGGWAGRYGDRLLYLAALALRLVGFALLGLMLLPGGAGQDGAGAAGLRPDHAGLAAAERGRHRACGAADADRGGGGDRPAQRDRGVGDGAWQRHRRAGGAGVRLFGDADCGFAGDGRGGGDRVGRVAGAGASRAGRGTTAPIQNESAPIVGLSSVSRVSRVWIRHDRSCSLERWTR